MSVPIPIEVLNRFVPSADGLLHHLRMQVDDRMLRKMALLDCGAGNAVPQFEALKLLRDTCVVPAPIGWEPREALQLACYGEPGAFGDPSEEEFRREHLARAFACAAMLRAEVEPENHFLGRIDGIASVVSSSLYLGKETEKQCGRFLAWRIAQLEEDEDRPFFALALVLLLFLSRPVNDDAVNVLCDWVFGEQDADRRFLVDYFHAGNSRLRLQFDCEEHRVWRILSSKLKECAACCANQQVRERLTEIAELVV